MSFSTSLFRMPCGGVDLQADSGRGIHDTLRNTEMSNSERADVAVFTSSATQTTRLAESFDKNTIFEVVLLEA